MTQQRLHAAMAPIDVLTRMELEETLTKHNDMLVRDIFRGVGYHETNGNGDSAAIVTVQGPESGYAWSIKIVSAQLTLTSDVLTVFLGDNTNSAPIATITPVTGLGGLFFSIGTFTSNTVVLKDARSITLASNSGILAYKIIAKQVPAEMVAKL
jgi:hypothetical protein